MSDLPNKNKPRVGRDDAMVEEAAKTKQLTEEEERPEPAFHASRGIGEVGELSVIKFEGGGRSAVVLGTLQTEKCLLTLTQKAACEDAGALVASVPSLAVTLTNHSGAEYSYYDAEGNGAQYSVEVIYPASAWQIDRKRPPELELVEETGAMYSDRIEAHVAKAATKIGWIDNVCSLQKEKERNLFADDAFIINIDTKWATHADCSSSDRATWHGAPWTRDLYLLAISKDAGLRSIRDLRGEAHADLCDRMRDELRASALRIYGVPATKLRIFFHYQPQFYRLHAHCVRVEYVNPGSEAERAHLLTSVAENLRLGDGDYYKDATITFKLRVGEPLHKLHTAAKDTTGACA